MAHTVIGMFDNSSEAQEAVQQLVSKGFSRENIDISTGSIEGSTTGNASSGNTIGSGSLPSGTSGDSSYTGSALTGDSSTGNALTGNTFSGSNDDVAGSGSLGSGSSYGSGYGSTGSGSGSTYSGTAGSEHHESGIGKFFRSLFGNDDEANTYSNVAQRSNSIVTVHAQTSDEAERAADILDDAGAVDVDERANQYGYGRSGSTDTTNTTGSGLASNVTTGEAGTSIPIIKEEIEVGKRTVQTGGKRLRSRIIERPVEESLRLREERVQVERNTVNRPATEADFANFKESEIELTEQAEVPVVSKQARVVEEVSLNKEVDEREETIRDTVRSTQVDVEDIEKDELRSKGSSNQDMSDRSNTF